MAIILNEPHFGSSEAIGKGWEFRQGKEVNLRSWSLLNVKILDDGVS